MDYGNLIYIFFIIIVIIAIVAFIWWISSFNPFCFGPLDGTPVCEIFSGIIGGGTTSGNDEGGPCTIDTDCKGWKPLGEVACCGNRCVKKDSASETCPQYCERHPEAKCGIKLGEKCSFDSDCNGWTLNGKIACCNNVCVDKTVSAQTCQDFCSSEPQKCGLPAGVQWCVVDPDCPGWTIFGRIACCKNRCVTKDTSVEGCAAFCNRRPNQCNNV